MFPARRFDIQTKIVLVLVAVILPTYGLVALIQSKVAEPLFEQELKQVGVTTAEAVAAEIVSNRLFALKDSEREIERLILQKLYFQPNILRMDVYSRTAPGETKLKLVASSVDEDPNATPQPVVLSERIDSEFFHGEDGAYWRIAVPIKQGGKKTPLRVLGMVHLLVSTRTANRILATFFKITAVGAGASVVIAIVLLNYFLRKTVANEKLLRQAENQNLQLTEQLHEAQRQMMNTEKLAVMGQLTANFAHEIGTPLNAIGGHLQLLKEELSAGSPPPSTDRRYERLEIISGELARIEKIVKGFLQTTSKPDSQRQLVDLNKLVDKTIHFVRPRLDGLGVSVKSQYSSGLGPLRLVPTDVEQIVLNLINNALDSLKAKRAQSPGARLQLRIATSSHRVNGEEWSEVSVHDTGTGIKKGDLKNVMKPFFTTKRPGEGTGLGLTICRELASKYGGVLEIKSKEGQWALVKLRIPYRANV